MLKPKRPTLTNILKLIVPSALGIVLFLVPFQSERGPLVLIGLMGYGLLSHIEAMLPTLIVLIMVISAVGALLARCTRAEWIDNHRLLSTLFDTPLFWLLMRIIGAILGIMTLLQIGPEWLWSAETGGMVLFELLPVLFIFFFLASLFLPFLLDYGLVELIGSLFHWCLRPLYRIPGSSGVDIMASLLGDGTVGTLITAKQYENGYYTAREAAIIASTFSIVSISFCVVVVNFVNLSHMFLAFYLTVVATCLLVGLILPRIWPLSAIPDTYHSRQPSTTEHSKNTASPSSSGWQLALAKAQSGPNIHSLIRKGATNTIDIWLVFVPIIMAIASVGLILGQTTDLFVWLGWPVAPFLELLGVPEAEQAAPAVLLGFADMFLPITVAVSIDNEMTRFIIAALAIAQLIYMSEVGVLIIRSAIPLNFWQLLVLFLLRTVLALPIIVLFARLIY